MTASFKDPKTKIHSRNLHFNGASTPSTILPVHPHSSPQRRHVLGTRHPVVTCRSSGGNATRGWTECPSPNFCCWTNSSSSPSSRHCPSPSTPRPPSLASWSFRTARNVSLATGSCERAPRKLVQMASLEANHTLSESLARCIRCSKTGSPSMTFTRACRRWPMRESALQTSHGPHYHSNRTPLTPSRLSRKGPCCARQHVTADLSAMAPVQYIRSRRRLKSAQLPWNDTRMSCRGSPRSLISSLRMGRGRCRASFRSNGIGGGVVASHSGSAGA